MWHDEEKYSTDSFQNLCIYVYVHIYMYITTRVFWLFSCHLAPFFHQIYCTVLCHTKQQSLLFLNKCVNIKCNQFSQPPFCHCPDIMSRWLTLKQSPVQPISLYEPLWVTEASVKLHMNAASKRLAAQFDTTASLVPSHSLLFHVIIAGLGHLL